MDTVERDAPAGLWVIIRTATKHRLGGVVDVERGWFGITAATTLHYMDTIPGQTSGSACVRWSNCVCTERCFG